MMMFDCTIKYNTILAPRSPSKASIFDWLQVRAYIDNEDVPEEGAHPSPARGYAWYGVWHKSRPLIEDRSSLVSCSINSSVYVYDTRYQTSYFRFQIPQI